MAEEVSAFVAKQVVEPVGVIGPGTLWPRSRMHWLPVTPETLDGLARLSGSYAEPEICDHVYVVRDGRMTLVWYDAFDRPLLLSADIPADRIASFGKAVGISPTPWHAA